MMSLNFHISCIASAPRVDPLFCRGIRKSWSQYPCFQHSDPQFQITEILSAPCSHLAEAIVVTTTRIWTSNSIFKTDINFDVRQIPLARTVTDCGLSSVSTNRLVSVKFVISQEGNTNTSVWCHVRNKTQSWCLRVLLFGDEIQTLLHPCHLSNLFQCYPRCRMGQNHWGRRTVSLCSGWKGCWVTKRFVLD